MNSNKKFIYKYWSYDICQNLETLPDKAIEAFKPKGRFYDDALSLYEILTISPHPALNSQVGKDTTDPSIIVFDNILVDINTLRIMFCLLPFTKIITLKFSKVSFEFINLEYLINNILSKPNNVINIFIEWNSDIRNDGRIIKNPEINYERDLGLGVQNTDNLLDDFNNNTDNIESINNQILSNNINNSNVSEILLKSKAILCKLSSHTKLDSLCLRGDFIGDTAAAIIFENLKNNQCLRVLNLFKNSLSSKSSTGIGSMLEINRKLEELNLGGNLFNNDDFKIITEQIGKKELNEEEIDSYNKKLKEKNEIIEKNKKQKAAKKPELPVPFVPEIEIMGERYFITKNNVLKTLNLMQNPLINKGIYNDIFKSLEKTEEVLTILDMKIFDKNEKDKLSDPKNKYTSKVYLVK